MFGHPHFEAPTNAQSRPSSFAETSFIAGHDGRRNPNALNKPGSISLGWAKSGAPIEKSEFDQKLRLDDVSPAFAMSFAAAAAVPPVASKSSISETRSPGWKASVWTSIAASPYSSL